MAYLCQNCGVTEEKADHLCNPISEEYKHKSCSTSPAEVCADNFRKMEYSCDCGNSSADPQHLCRPHKMS